jgi:hypothetical protein
MSRSRRRRVMTRWRGASDSDPRRLVRMTAGQEASESSHAIRERVRTTAKLYEPMQRFLGLGEFHAEAPRIELRRVNAILRLLPSPCTSTEDHKSNKMSDYSSDSASSKPANERLDVPTLPPPSSRFVLPPPPSDLLNRLQAFLPQIRDANALLEQQQAAQPEGTQIEEPVVMEELSDSSSSDDDDDDEEEEGHSDSDDDSSNEASSSGADGESAGNVGADESLQDASSNEDVEQGSLARLMDISSRPKVGKKKLLVQEQLASTETKEVAEGEAMQAE